MAERGLRPSVMLAETAVHALTPRSWLPVKRTAVYLTSAPYRQPMSETGKLAGDGTPVDTPPGESGPGTQERRLGHTHWATDLS